MLAGSAPSAAALASRAFRGSWPDRGISDTTQYDPGRQGSGRTAPAPQLDAEPGRQSSDHLAGHVNAETPSTDCCRGYDRNRYRAGPGTPNAPRTTGGGTTARAMVAAVCVLF